MRYQHRFCALHVGVGWHGRIPSLFGAIQECRDQLGNGVTDLIATRPHIEPQVSRNLLIAAAPAMQLVTGIADQLHQLFLNKMMDVFHLSIVEVLG